LEDGKILYANDNLGELIGYKKEDLVGRLSPDFYYDLEDRKKVIEILEREGKINNFEVRIKKRDGTVFWSLFSLTITELSGEKVVMGSLYDISKRKKAEEKLRLYRQLYLNSEDGIVILGSDGSYIESNPVHLKRSGFSLEELKEKGVDGIIGPKAGNIFRDGMATGHSIRREVSAQLKDGSEITVDISAFPIRNAKGKITNIAGIGRDITEQKKAQEALRFSEEKFRSLVENATDIIYSMTPDGIFSYISPQFTKVTGLNVTEFLGKPIHTFFHPEEAKKCCEWIEMGMPKDVTSEAGFVFRGKTNDSGWRWYTTNASLIKDKEGNIIEAVGIAHDITDMKRMFEEIEKANLELREAQSQLVQSAKMPSLGQLVAGIAHEINTPVGAISSMHDTLMRGVRRLKNNITPLLDKNDTESQKLASIMKIIEDANTVIESGTERVTTIVKRLRSFARLDEAELKTVDIHEGLEDTLTLIHHEIKHHITLKKEYGNLPPIACFPGRLNQVFLNILNNARHAISDKGEVTIKTYQKSKMAYIAISDNGSGVSPQNLKKIFDPGFTTKGVGVGTGLGLSICFQIMKDHRGTINVESEIGRGTTFTISLPTNLDEVIGNDKKN
jgi:PAS domain S-box-containing protein